MRTQLLQALADIEHELKILDEWDSTPPSAEALASTQPFCIDTLRLPQWLQFIFLPRLHMMIIHEQPLPKKCGIAPIAEEYFRHTSQNGQALINLLTHIDELLNHS